MSGCAFVASSAGASLVVPATAAAATVCAAANRGRLRIALRARSHVCITRVSNLEGTPPWTRLIRCFKGLLSILVIVASMDPPTDNRKGSLKCSRTGLLCRLVCSTWLLPIGSCVIAAIQRPPVKRFDHRPTPKLNLPPPSSLAARTAHPPRTHQGRRQNPRRHPLHLVQLRHGGQFVPHGRERAPEAVSYGEDGQLERGGEHGVLRHDARPGGRRRCCDPNGRQVW